MLSEKELKKLDKLFSEGRCWECESYLIVDFIKPDKDNWVLASCPLCDYSTFVPRKI